MAARKRTRGARGDDLVDARGRVRVRKIADEKWPKGFDEARIGKINRRLARTGMTAKDRAKHIEKIRKTERDAQKGRQSGKGLR